MGLVASFLSFLHPWHSVVNVYCLLGLWFGIIEIGRYARTMLNNLRVCPLLVYLLYSCGI